MRRQILAQHLRETLALLPARTRIVLLGQVPELSRLDVQRIARFELSLPRAEIDAWHADEAQLLAGLAEPGRVEVFDSRWQFCDRQECRTRLGGQLLYADDNHLSGLGARWLWQRLLPVLQAGPASPG